jgi:hypothetical protein
VLACFTLDRVLGVNAKLRTHVVAATWCIELAKKAEKKASGFRAGGR